MAKRITTPIMILIFFYIIIVALILIIITLGALAVYDFNNYFKNSEDYFAMKCCKKYLNENRIGLYEECYILAKEKLKEKKNEN